MSHSNAEAEFRGVANTIAKLMWLRNLFFELSLLFPRASVFFSDNLSVLYLSSNPIQRHCTKHVEIDIHFV